MKVQKILFCIFCVGILLFISNLSFAQCAMCTATVESNLEGGGNTASSLNTGIMYLLAAPYLVVAGIGFLWYKKYRRKEAVIDIKPEKINLN
ncbi:hypothetical protein BCY91_12440 [Pelobium manganitolerans]|uniref:Adenylosuccinate synthetase n=1 Tax=Pelobium manganitolerans TaxID=1842495 RepID=A0A419S1U5_9SPHI|nr:hypothetical protein [Pelobium manganitolerans]RKD12447.1 hypothetical protein BCY91_12440 [Pelobium manganitolerans]